MGSAADYRAEGRGIGSRQLRKPFALNVTCSDHFDFSFANISANISPIMTIHTLPKRKFRVELESC